MTFFAYQLFLSLVLVFCFNFCAGAQLLNCPQNQIKFEKLIGIKPNHIQSSILLYSSPNNHPVTLECTTKCANDKNCISFLLYYNSSECYSFRNVVTSTQNYDYDSRPDTNVAWFRKTCLNVPASCNKKAWAVEVSAGATLVVNGKKIRDRITRQRCIELCLQENEFLCKSATFSVVSRYAMTDADPVGYCVLSDTDRHLTTSAFRVSRYEDEYIENNCVNTTFSPDFCAYEEYENSTLKHTDLLLSNLSQEHCQEMCDMSITFNCRGYSIVPSTELIRGSNIPKYSCHLHSEDSKLVGPKLLIRDKGARYYERARCLNVSVSCTNNYMSIAYTPEQPFSGKIYLYGYSDTPPCYSKGQYNRSVQLNIPLNVSSCGIVEARTAEPLNRTLKSGLLVIQYNALIETQADRLIKVGCVYGNSVDDNEITLGASVNFSSNFPTHGTTIVNNSTVLPTVSMRIVDYNTGKPTTDTEIGQELQMIIEITPRDGPYDIWASNLVATSGNNTLQLLDDHGCPTSLNIFSPFTRIPTNISHSLVSNFQAFKFPSTPLVRFSVIVHFCTVECPQMPCTNDQNGENRVRRDSNFQTKEQMTNSEVNATVYKINGRKNPNNTDDMIEEMPLDILLFVRGVNIAADQLQLAYGENNRILVAGYDIINNEVCVDYSLFVGLLVTWVLLQVIIVVCCCLLIRKYKKYFHIEYSRQLDDMHQNFGFSTRDFGRRVHWADQ